MFFFVLFNKKILPLECLNIVVDENGSLIVVDICMYEDKFRFLCSIAPNSVAEMEMVFTHLFGNVESAKIFIVLGDLNCVYYANDWSRANAPSDWSARFLEERIENCCLVDVEYLKANPNELTFTLFKGTSHARLDRIYASVSVFNDIRS